MVKNASLIVVCNGDYLLQVRNLANPILEDKKKFVDGEYPFIFPGACSFFGGALEEGEDAEQGFVREVIKEELPGLIISEKPEHRQYDWSKQVDEVIQKANEALHGNIEGLLGFDLNAYVPQCVLGKSNRGKNLTYKEWLAMTTEDNFFVAKLNKPDLEGIAVKEGSGKVWVPHYLARGLTLVPSDKLALIDDYADRVLSGEIVLK